MASVRTRDPDALCYTTQSMWACYEFTIPKSQPQIADKVTALQRLIDIQTGGWDLDLITHGFNWTRDDSAETFEAPVGGSRWKPSSGPSRPSGPFYGYRYETFGFTMLLAKMLGGSRHALGAARNRLARMDYYEVSQFAHTQSRLINFATYAGAKMFCEEEDGATTYGATTCEIDNTRTISRTLSNSKTGKLYYPKGAKDGYKIIVSTWVNEYGDLSVRWAKSYPIYSNSAAFDLVASG